MSETWLYKLRPHSPFHFGASGLGAESTDEVFHSDSLFAALATAVRMWYGENVLDDLLSRFDQGPPFRLTSLFPYAGGVLLFPNPLPDSSYEPPCTEADRRSAKKTRFVSQGILQATLQGDRIDPGPGSRNTCQAGRVWLTETERQTLPFDEQIPTIWHRHVVPRASVDRVVLATSARYVELLSFRRGCGLFFLLDFEDDATRELLESALQFLSDAGLGGQRSAGCGKFSVESASRFDPFWGKQGDLLMTLSLYHPTREELEAGALGEGARYRLVPRSGWAGSPERQGQRWKSSVFLEEGSVIRAVGARSYGDLVDVTPQAEPEKHPVYRYGFAYPIGIRTAGAVQ